MADARNIRLCAVLLFNSERHFEGCDDQMASAQCSFKATSNRAGGTERRNMKINSEDFKVREGDAVNLRKWPTKVEPFYKSKQQYRKLWRAHVAQLSAQQQLL